MTGQDLTPSCPHGNVRSVSSQEQDKSAGIGTYVRLTPQERERLMNLAAKERRNLSDQIRFIIDRHFAEQTP